jgi:hypothetical protein
MSDSTPGIAKAVTAGGVTAVGGEIANILDPIIAHAWPWLAATPGVLSSMETIVVAGLTFAATYFIPHQIGGNPPPSK